MFLEIVELFSCGYKGVFLSACRCVYCLIRIVLLLRVCFRVFSYKCVFRFVFLCAYRREGGGEMLSCLLVLCLPVLSFYTC